MTGAGGYLADLCDASTLHAVFVRSPVASATVHAIDRTAASSAPGVMAVFTGADLDLVDIPGQTGRGPRAEAMTRPALARDRVRHVGEPVAVVVARTAAQAADAAGMVWPELEETVAVTDPRAAREGGPLLFPEAGTNIVAHDVLGEGLAAGVSPQVRVTVEVDSPRLAPLPIEPLGILARPAGEGVRVWCGHQAPHRLRKQLASLLGMAPESIRVTVPDVGGAFGMKGMLYPEYLVVTAAAIRLGAPVVWVQTRREQFASGTHGRSQHHTVTLSGDADGRIASAEIEILADVGAYPHNGSQIPTFSRLVATGLYDIPAVRVETTLVVTNQAPTGSYRGAGRPEAALAIERAVDAFARRAGLDPFAVRERNLVRSLPHRTPTGALYDSGDYVAALSMARRALDVDGVRAAQAVRLAGGQDPIGVGVGAFVERAGGAVDSGEYARVEVDPVARTVVVRVGTSDSGQGHATVWSGLAGEVLKTDRVVVRAGDTSEVASGVGTYASRSAQLAGSAVVRTATRVLEEARRRAADRLEALVEDVEYRQGVFHVAGVPGSEVSLWDVAAAELGAEETFAPGAQTFPYGVHGAVVEVSLETGEVRVLRIVAVDDCGRVLHPVIVEGQLHGSLAQGLGQALYEQMRYDVDGQPLTGSLMDYLAPRATDVPPIESMRLEHPAPSNPLGVKGAGEAGCIGLPPAILNATIDALWPHGVRDLQLPLRPQTVWQAIEAARTA